jgi:hypothetical protein
MMITVFYVNNSAQPLEERRFVVRKLLVKGRIDCGIDMNKKPPPLGGAICSQFVPRLCAACSPFEYLLEYVVIAVNVVVLLSQRCDSATRVEDGCVVAVAERIADIR